MPNFSLLAVFAALHFCLLPRPATAIDEFSDLKRIGMLPQTAREVRSAYRTSSSDSCEPVPEGESLEIRSFTTYLTTRDRHLAKGPPLPSSRRSLLTVGLEIQSADQVGLPALSRGRILNYLKENHITIQVRMRKDLLDRKLYYHHRPVATTSNYLGSKLTKSFEPVVASTVRDFHGLGLFVPESVTLLKPEHLRTMVLLFRTELLTGTGGSKEAYEYVFVRGVESNSPEGLEHRVFVTSAERTQVHLLQPFDRPLSVRQCSVVGKIAITRFDSSGIYPREAGTRSYSLDEQASLRWTSLDQFCETKGLQGGAAANLTQALDAIISGELQPETLTLDPEDP
jgi:hypothetical protein